MPTSNDNQQQRHTNKPPRRVIDLTETELSTLIEAKLMAFGGSGPDAIDPDRALTRKQAAALLEISLTQLDLLCRPERKDPIPYSVVGESRRFVRAELTAWLRRQREVAA